MYQIGYQAFDIRDIKIKETAHNNSFTNMNCSGQSNKRDHTTKDRRSIKSPTAKNAERERSRVRSLRNAFHLLQCCLPLVPPNTKLSKLDILILATNYIGQLTRTLDECDDALVKIRTPPLNHISTPDLSERYQKYYHPMKKWPMRFRLYSLLEEQQTHNADRNNNNNCISDQCDHWNKDQTDQAATLTKQIY